MSKTKQRIILIAFVVFVVSLVFIGTTQAERYGFICITNGSISDAGIGEAQLFMDVTPEGDNQVLFTFTNTGPEASSITDIYFDDGTLLGIADIDNSAPDVVFSMQATPSDLPDGNNISPPFVTSVGFSIDSDPAVQPHGINPGESLGIVFDLKNGGTFANIISELGDDTLRAGIRVQGFDDEGSESFVSIVPAPPAVVLVMIGLALFGGASLRRRLC